MKIIIKIFSIIIIFSSSFLLLANKSDSIHDIIEKSPIAKNSTISISVRDTRTEKIIYECNANLLLHPASALKAYTTPVILDKLGINSKISTGIYSDKSGNIYLKLSGDPLLQTNELSKLLSKFKAKDYTEIKGCLYVDDSSIDDIPWGTGWMWDDENNPYMPKISAYSLNRNIISIKIIPTGINQKPTVKISPYYPVKIVNNAITSNINSISAERKIWKSAETIFISGKIFKTTQIELPIGSPENFFKYRFLAAAKDAGIKFSGSYKKAAIPKNAVLIAEISHNTVDEVRHLNKYSDNLAAESLFKLAGRKFTGKKGTTENGFLAFKDFYSKRGLGTSEIYIVDASGVSHNDLITANWMTLALAKLTKWQNFNSYKSTLAIPGNSGTLQNRLEELAGRLSAKTGTNAGMSSITGYLNDKTGKPLAFAIIIQNFKGSSKPAKELEDSILKKL